MTDKQGTRDKVPDAEEKRDQSLKDSMDASDPPSNAKPGDDGEPVPSSGYDPAPE